MAPYVTGSRVTGSYVTSSATPSAAARAFKWLGLIAAMTVYCYSLPLRAMEETLGRDDRSGQRRQGSPGTETLIVRNAAIADLTLLKPGGAIVANQFHRARWRGQPLGAIADPCGRNALLVQRGLDRSTTRKRPACNRVLPKRASYCNVLKAVGFGAPPKVAAKNPSTAPIRHECAT